MRRTTTRVRVRRGAVALAVVAMGPMALPTDASATTRIAAPDTLDALIALESEVMALVELGAFPTPLPAKLIEVDNEWRDAVEGYSRSDLLDWLRSSEIDGVAELQALGSADLSPAVRDALRELPGDAVRAIEAGQVMPMPAELYEHALNDLEYRNGAPPKGEGAGAANGSSGNGPAATAPQVTTAQPNATAPAPPPTDLNPTTVAGTTVAPTTDLPAELASTDQDAAPSADRADGPPIILIGGVLAGLVAAGVVAFLARRRRRDESGDLGGSVAALLDASRRLSSSVDATEICRILADESAALTRSDLVAIIVNEGDGTVVAAETGDGQVHLANARRGAVGRVLETGAVVRSVGLDPVLGTEEQAIVVVPLVRDGAVAGAVLAARRPTQPYGTAELDLLGQLVPIAASALVAAGRHDDVALLSLTDGLTELGNRRRLDRDLVSVLGAGVGTVGFVMVDIDHFKHFNDTNGHVAGDEVLRQVAAVLRGNVRDHDVVYRYGGEEFCVLLPDASAAEAADVSERLRRAVEATDFEGAGSQPGGRLTISVGTTVASRTDPTAIKERADHALYEAKHQGRNRVVVDGGDTPGEPDAR